MSDWDKLKKLRKLMQEDVPREFYADRWLKQHDEGIDPLTFKVDGKKLIVEKPSGFSVTDRHELLNRIQMEIDKEGLGIKIKPKGKLESGKWELEFE